MFNDKLFILALHHYRNNYATVILSRSFVISYRVLIYYSIFFYLLLLILQHEPVIFFFYSIYLFIFLFTLSPFISPTDSPSINFSGQRGVYSSSSDTSSRVIFIYYLCFLYSTIIFFFFLYFFILFLPTRCLISPHARPMFSFRNKQIRKCECVSIHLYVCY